MFHFGGKTHIQFKLSLGTVRGHSGVDKDLHQEVINKIIDSVILQLVLQLVFSSATSANRFINSTLFCLEPQTSFPGLV